MFYRRVMLLTLLLMGLYVSAFSEDSLMSRYNSEQTGYTPEKIKLPLALNWEYSTTKIENKAVPVVAGNTVIYASGDRIYALSLDTGAMKWKYPSDKGLGGYIKTTPAIYGGLVFFGATNGNVYSLKLDTGVLQWIYQTKGSIRCPPIVADDVVYIGSDDNSLYAVDYQTGVPIWRKPFTAIDDINGGIVVSNGMVVAVSMDGNLYGLNESSGKLRWSSRLPSAAINTAPMIYDNVVIMATGNVVKGFHVRSGQMRWTLGFSYDIAASPVVKEGDLYVPCSDGKIYAFSLSTREPSVKWALPVDIGQKPASAPIVAKDTIFITGTRGLIAALDAETGVKKWTYTVASKFKKTSTSTAANPAGAGAFGAMPGGAGGVMGATSQIIEQTGVEPISIEASPVVANGSLLIVSDDGVLRCFQPTAIDAEIPVFFNLLPAKNARVSASPPLTISAEVLDIGSGVDYSTVSLGIMEPGTSSFKPLEYEIDKLKSVVTYKFKGALEGQPVKLLPDGVNTLRLSAKDYFGNMMIKEWTFIADSSISPPSVVREPDKGVQNRTTPTRNPVGRSGRGGNVPAADAPPPPPMPGTPGPGTAPGQ